MDLLKKDRIYTVEDIYALPEGELVEGRLYYMVPPSRTHQKISGRLYQKISNFIDSHGGTCEVYHAPFAVFLNKDDVTYFEPDISVICDLSKLDEKGCHGAPEWIIEIVSPGNKAMDYYTKLLQYQAAGVQEYWIVDPAREQITVYQFENVIVEQYSFGEDIPVGIYEGSSIKL